MISNAMLKSLRKLFLAAFCLTALASCQHTNLTDLIDYSRIPDRKLENYQKDITLKFERKVAILDEDDRMISERTLPRGAKVTLLGYKGRVGGRILKPEFFRENYTPVGEWYLVKLADGSRAFCELPETAIGVVGKDGNSVTDVKKKGDTNLFLYKTANSAEWTDNPGIKYDVPKDIAVYYAKIKRKDLKLIENPNFFQKVVNFFAKLDHSINRFTLNRILYRKGEFYSYHPLLNVGTVWARIIQQILSWLLVFPLFMFLLPKLALETVWHIKFLPNWVVKVLALILTLVYAYFLGTFLSVTLWGGIIYGVLILVLCSSTISVDVNWTRCPYCHELNISFVSQKFGDWHDKTSTRDREEVKYQTKREYDSSDGHVIETTDHMGIKRYTTMLRYRTETTTFHCNHCGREVVLNDTEEHTRESSQWL